MSQVSPSPADPVRAPVPAPAAAAATAPLPPPAPLHLSAALLAPVPANDAHPAPRPHPAHVSEAAPPGLLRRALGVLAEAVVAVYVVADTAVSLLFRPLFRFLSSLRIVQRLERAINALPPYVILVAMAVPFAIAEVAKVFAVYWMAEGHMRSGMTIFIGAYVVSIFVCERILHAGKPKLMTIPWFAWGYNWVMVIKEHVFGWFRGTAVWRLAIQVRDRAKGVAQRFYARLRSLFEGRQGGRDRQLGRGRGRGAPARR